MTTVPLVTLRWENHLATIGSVEQLNTSILLLEQEGQQSKYPFFGELVIEPLILMISFGRSLSAVRFYDKLSRKGDHSLGETSNELEVVFYGGHWTEISRGELIPYSQAREALRIFYLTRAKPQNIQWEWGN